MENCNTVDNTNKNLSFGCTDIDTSGSATLSRQCNINQDEDKETKACTNQKDKNPPRLSELFCFPMDYERLCSYCTEIAEKYPHVRLCYIGNSLLSRKIPMLCLGEGEKSVFYIGTHHASEWICSAVLLKFMAEAAEYEAKGAYAYASSLGFLCRQRTVCVLPMLNVDGTELSIHGTDKQNPLMERLIRANGSEDFTHWQANARGVDLNHNYNFGYSEYKAIEQGLGIVGTAPSRYSGEYAESEPEVSCVCNFLRYTEPSLVLSLHTQGEVIYAPNSEKIKHGEEISDRLCAMTRYKREKPCREAMYGGLCDWYTSEIKKPAYTLECGLGKSPLPLCDAQGIYAKIRQALFVSPMLV